jgi:hypothetical protein
MIYSLDAEKKSGAAARDSPTDHLWEISMRNSYAAAYFCPSTA